MNKETIKEEVKETRLTKADILKMYPRTNKDTLFMLKRDFEKNKIDKAFISEMLINERYSVPVLFKILQNKFGVDKKFKKSTFDRYIAENEIRKNKNKK